MKTAPVAAQPLDWKTGLGAAVLTGLALAASSGLIRLELTKILFLLAPWVVLPVAVNLIPPVADSRLSASSRRLHNAMVLPAAVLTTASFFLPAGRLAAVLASAWLPVCLLLASEGLLRLLRYQQESFAQFCFAVGPAYLVVGALWLVISRLGSRPLGFDEPIVLLTAVHFHFAGFLSAVLAGLTYQRLRTAPWAGCWRAAFFGVTAGPAFLGIAFLVGPKLKLLAALLIATGQFGLAAAMFRAGIAAGQGLGRWMLSISAGCVVAGMALAATWASGEYPLHQFVNLDQMVRFHGVLNALGFGLCGLFGWAQILGASHSNRET